MLRSGVILTVNKTVSINSNQTLQPYQLWSWNANNLLDFNSKFKQSSIFCLT